TPASARLAALAASRCSASNHTVRAVKRTRPDTSSRASPSGTMDGQEAGSQPDGAEGNDPGSTWACASISNLGPRHDRDVHRVLARHLSGQRLDGPPDVLQAERVSVHALQREAPRLDQPDGLGVTAGVHAERAHDGERLVD